MKRRPVCLVCLILMFCIWLMDLAGFARISGNPLPESVQLYIEKHPEAVICGEVQQYQATDYSLSAYLKHVCLIVGSEQIPIKNLRVFLKSNKEFPIGTTVKISGKLEEIPEPRNPGEFDSRQFYACQKIYYFMKNGVVLAWSSKYSRYGQFMQNLKSKIMQTLDIAAKEDAGIFEAMLLGEKDNLEDEVKIRYQMAGIIHILAISGLHISVLGIGFFDLLKRAGFGNVSAGMVVLSVLLQYGILTGESVSAMRAVGMFLLAVGARIAGRTYDLLTALAVSAVLLLLDAPANLYNSGFWLSFGAVAGLGVVAPVLAGCIRVENRLAASVMKTLVSSIAVQMTTFPIMLRVYGEISLAGFFLNLLVLPTVSVVLVSGIAAVAVGMASVSAAVYVVLPGRVLLFLYEKLCELAAGIPFCTWMMKGFFDTIPISLEEAARVDGAGRFRIFSTVILPLTVPGLVATGIFSFINGWNEYLFASTFMKSYENWTLPIGIASFSGQYATNWGTLMAGAVLITLPVVLMFLLLQKHLVSGMTAGAVKQ